MNAADRAIAILRAGLAEKRAHQYGPHATLTKCEFCRELDAAPFPADPPPSLKAPGKRITATLFGTWLHEHNHPEFCRLFEAWRARQ